MTYWQGGGVLGAFKKNIQSHFSELINTPRKWTGIMDIMQRQKKQHTVRMKTTKTVATPIYANAKSQKYLQRNRRHTIHPNPKQTSLSWRDFIFPATTKVGNVHGDKIAKIQTYPIPRARMCEMSKEGIKTLRNSAEKMPPFFITPLFLILRETERLGCLKWNSLKRRNQ